MQYSRHCCITNVAHGRSDANYFGKDACELRTIERMNCQSTTGAPDSSALSQTFAMHLRATSDPPYSVFMLLLRQIQVFVTALCFIFISKLVTCVQLPSYTELPPTMQETNRVLVTISGIWGTSENEREKLYFLSLILNNYVHACEYAYEIHIVLVTYKGTWEETLDMSVFDKQWGRVDFASFHCARLGRVLPVALALFQHEPLPNNTFGTGGTLASKHRIVYKSLAQNYDLFVHQEDDIFLTGSHIKYFLHWSNLFGAYKLYPGFVTIEIPSKRVNVSHLMQDSLLFLEWRIQDMIIGYFRNVLLAKMPMAIPFFYMVTRDMLMDAISSDEWLNPPVSGEYNPYFNLNWLLKDYKVVIPLSNLHHSIYQHASNKYYNTFHYNLNFTEHPDWAQYQGYRLSEVNEILRECTTAPIFPKHYLSQQTVFFRDGDTCGTCLRSKKWTYLRSSKLNETHIKVSSNCVAPPFE